MRALAYVLILSATPASSGAGPVPDLPGFGRKLDLLVCSGVPAG